MAIPGEVDREGQPRMNPEFLLLTGYSVAILAASLLGGWLPSLVQLTHTRTQLMMSLVSGLMLGVALLHLFPQALRDLTDPHAVTTAVSWMLLGIMFMLVLLRLSHFHRHDFSHGDKELAQQDLAPQDLVQKGLAPHDAPRPSAHPLSWIGVAVGMGLHVMVEAFALGASVRSAGPQPEGATWAGMAVFVAICLHKPLDAFSITGVMRAGGWSRRARTLANLGFALLWPLGLLLFFYGMAHAPAYEDLILAPAMAFSAGAFLCIALYDLLPEVQHHRHDRIKLTLTLLLGVLIAWLLGPSH